MRPPIIPLALLATILVAIPIATYAAGDGAPALLVPYSGTLELNGAPATGTFEMTFRLYDGDENDGAATEIFSETRDVDVAAGQFAVSLGSQSEVPEAAVLAADLFVSVAVEGTQLGNRQRVTPALQAVRAANATSLDVTGPVTANSVSTNSLNATSGAVAGILNVGTVDADNVDSSNIDATNYTGTRITVNDVTQVGGEAGFNFTGDHANNGYVRFGSVQIAWGQRSQNFAAGSETAVSFPASFATTPSVTVSLDDPGFGGADATSNVGARSVNANNFRILFKGSGGQNIARWMAVGRWR